MAEEKTDCKYYDKKICGENCTDTWVKCDICKNPLDWVGEEYEVNGYEIMSASISCDDSENYGIVLRVCPDCFKKFKELIKKDGN